MISLADINRTFEAFADINGTFEAYRDWVQPQKVTDYALYKSRNIFFQSVKS